MKGIHTLTIQSAHLKYEMKFSRFEELPVGRHTFEL